MQKSHHRCRSWLSIFVLLNLKYGFVQYCVSQSVVISCFVTEEWFAFSYAIDHSHCKGQSKGQRPEELARASFKFRLLGNAFGCTFRQLNCRHHATASIQEAARSWDNLLLWDISVSSNNPTPFARNSLWGFRCSSLFRLSLWCHIKISNHFIFAQLNHPAKCTVV